MGFLAISGLRKNYRFTPYSYDCTTLNMKPKITFRTQLQVSYVKALDIWVSMCTAFVFCVLLEYTLVSAFYFDNFVRKLGNFSNVLLLT